jgi:hypothetical protein
MNNARQDDIISDVNDFNNCHNCFGSLKVDTNDDFENVLKIACEIQTADMEFLHMFTSNLG